MNILIDTTKQETTEVSLLDSSGSVIKKLSKRSQKVSENLLPLLEKLLKAKKVQLNQIDKVLVNPGPGGFSSTRTGVAVANALAFALNIPVAEYPSRKVKKVVLPKYDKMPNITRQKRKL